METEGLLSKFYHVIKPNSLLGVVGQTGSFVAGCAKGSCDAMGVNAGLEYFIPFIGAGALGESLSAHFNSSSPDLKETGKETLKSGLVATLQFGVGYGIGYLGSKLI